MKKCYRCLIEKDSSQFGQDKSRSDGLNSACKECNRISATVYRQKNREKNKTIIESKYCNDCKLTLHVSFFQLASGTPDGFQAYCRSCGTARRRASRYSITREQYREMISTSCEACGSREKLGIDHDHNCCSGPKSCGKCIRGVLCSKCNTAEGLLGSVENITGLLEYMKRVSE